MYDVIESTPEFLVIYKYPDVNFHCEAGQLGLFESVKQRENLAELYPVHRLDKITSGLLVMAKTAAVNQELVEQFRLRNIEKYYLAISGRKPKKKQGLIKGDMERTRRGAWKLLVSQKNPAITQFVSSAFGDGKRLFLIKPHTGQTHQIRVALKSIGAPVWGDELYAESEACAGVDRAYLHAFQLGFSLAGEVHRFQLMPRHGELFLSPAFSQVLNTFSQPDQLPWPSV